MFIERSMSFLVGMPILTIIEGFKLIKAKKLKKSFLNFREINIIAFSIYVMLLLSVTMLPIYTSSATTPTINLIPIFNTVNDIIEGGGLRGYNEWFWGVNIVGNLILLMPLALFIPIIFKRFRNIKLTVGLCFGVSFAIELLQYFSSYIGNVRATDIDDLILNTLGGFLGYLMYKFVSDKAKSNHIRTKYLLASSF